jgi:multidrug resistance protein, MATE family
MPLEQELESPPQDAALRSTESDSPGLASSTLRELLRVAVPLIISSGSQSLMHVIDRIFLTWHSVDAVAASLPSGMLYWAVLSFPFGTAVYTNTFVAQYTGSGKPDRVTASLWQGVRFALIAGLLLSCCGMFAKQMLSWTGHTGPVGRMEAEYFSASCYGALPALLSVVLSAFFGGRGRTMVIMYVHIITSIINGFFDYALIFGVGPFPAMGIAGAAWGTNIANVVACLLFGWLSVKAMRSEGYPVWETWRFDRELTLRMLRFGLPTGFQYLVDVGAFLVFTVFVGRLGTTELAATTIAFNLNSMAFIPMFGLGTAVLTVVGRRIGEKRKDEAARTAWCGFGVATVYMGVFIILYLTTPHLMLLPYAASSNPAEFNAVQPLVVTLLRFVALYSFFDAMAIVFGSAIRGAGDSQFSLWWTFGTSWALMVLPTWYAAEHGTANLLNCWWAASIYIMVLGLGFLARFLHGKWRTMTVMGHDHEAAPVHVVG